MADELLLPDAHAWHAWLGAHVGQTEGVWLVLARKGTTAPTSLRYAEALEAALCFGWIDGQKAKRDEWTFIQKFSPRRARSIWSKINVDSADRLIAEGKMHPAGLAEVEKARADGRWDRAYHGSAKAAVPADLQAALDGSPEAKEMWSILTSTNRYAILFRIQQVRREETRARKITEFVQMLERGETLHPQKAVAILRSEPAPDGPQVGKGRLEQGGPQIGGPG